MTPQDISGGLRAIAKSLRGGKCTKEEAASTLDRWAARIEGGALSAGPQPKPEARRASLADFARDAIAAARQAPASARFPQEPHATKVFLVGVWRALDRPGDLETFKARAVEAHRAGLLTLSRADLVEAMPARDVRESEARYLGEQYHFLRLPEHGRR